MLNKKVFATLTILGAIAVGTLLLTAARRHDTIEVTDFDKVIRATRPAYDARLRAESDAEVK